MSVRKILSTTNPRLHQVSKPVTKFDKKLQDLLKDLKDTLKAQNDPEGVGLAAPQIGEFVRVFIIQTAKHGLLTFINPEITKVSEKTNDPSTRSAPRHELGPNARSGQAPKEEEEYILEGCLSLPHLYGPVRRAASVTVKYQTPQMKNVQQTFRGFVAQVIQHEIDHLNGKVFTERLLEQKRKLYKQHGDHWHEVELP